MIRSQYRKLAMAMAGLVVALTSGCANVLSLFNQDFLTSAGVGPQAANLPGEAPQVLMVIENRTSRWVEARLSWRQEADTVDSKTFVVPPGDKLGEVIACPLTEVTLGDVANLDQAGALVRLGTGAATDPFVEVEPFGVLLKDNANYDCGDSITFAVQTSGETASGYRIFAYIQRAEAP